MCGAGRNLVGGDLHHRRYRRPGQERFEDLLPMDRACHDRWRALWDTTNLGWRRIDRPLANDLMVGLLRRTRTAHP